MKKQVNHVIRKRFNDIIYNIARYTEIFLSVVILVVIALAGVRLICDVAGTSIKMCIRDREMVAATIFPPPISMETIELTAPLLMFTTFPFS